VSAQKQNISKELLCISLLPEYPWQVIGTDLFELEGKRSLFSVDYLTWYPEVTQLINQLKTLFARHGTLGKKWSDKWESVFIT